MSFNQSYEKIFKGVLPSQIWSLWSDINRRTEWDTDTEWAKMEGKFEAGQCFYFKPKGGPKLKMWVTEATQNCSFTDCFKLPLARLYGIHELFETPEGICVRTTIKLKGFFSFVLIKLGNDIVKSLPEQTELMIQLAQKEPK